MEMTESAQKNQSPEKEDSSVTVAKVSLSMGQLAKMWTSATVEMCKLKWLKNIGIYKFKTLYILQLWRPRRLREHSWLV